MKSEENQNYRQMKILLSAYFSFFVGPESLLAYIRNINNVEYPNRAKVNIFI